MWCPVEHLTCSVLITGCTLYRGKRPLQERHWYFWVKSKLLSHTFKDFLQLLLWTLPNTVLFITTEKQTQYSSLPLRSRTSLHSEVCARWLVSSPFFLSVSLTILRLLTSVLQRLFSLSAERCLEPLHKRTLHRYTA